MDTTTLTVRQWLDSCQGLDALSGIPGLDPGLGSRADMLRDFAFRVRDRFLAYRKSVRNRAATDIDEDGNAFVRTGSPEYLDAQEKLNAVLETEVTAPFPPLGVTRSTLRGEIQNAVNAGSIAPPGALATWLRHQLVQEEREVDPVEEELDRVFTDTDDDSR